MVDIPYIYWLIGLTPVLCTVAIYLYRKYKAWKKKQDKIDELIEWARENPGEDHIEAGKYSGAQSVIKKIQKEHTKDDQEDQGKQTDNKNPDEQIIDMMNKHGKGNESN